MLPESTVTSAIDHPQSGNRVVMVRPAAFGYNPETAADNAFMSAPDPTRPRPASEVALEEFDGLVAVLRAAGVEVLVVEDVRLPPKPDAVFLNNWFSTDISGTLVLYPMYAPTRRIEREGNVQSELDAGFRIERLVELQSFESSGVFLEGTGSIVPDRPNRIAYVCRSGRSDETLARQWAADFDHELVIFDAVDPDGLPIYHTNVVMAIGTDTAIFCPAVCPQEDAARVIGSLESHGKRVVQISWEQLSDFAGNAIEVVDGAGRARWVMSTRAYGALTPAQREILEAEAPILHAPIPTIERLGGGSARCMIAQNFLPIKE